MTPTPVNGTPSPWYAHALGSYASPAGADAERRPSRRDAASDGEPSAAGTPSESSSAATPAEEVQPGAISSDDVTSPRAKSNLLALASRLGTDPDTLLAHLSSGQSIRSLLPAGGRAGYGSPVAQSTSGGIAIDTYV